MPRCRGHLNGEVVSTAAVEGHVPRVSCWYVGASKEVGRWVEERCDTRDGVS
jgi:hypothetical protein